MQRELHLNTEKVMVLINMGCIASNKILMDAETPTSDEDESN